MMYRPSYSSKSEWQMPTFRERTSTSSAAMVGTSRSRTSARCGSSKTRAFMAARSSLIDEHLDLVRRSGGESGEGIRCTLQRDHTSDNPLYRQIAGRDLRRD